MKLVEIFNHQEELVWQQNGSFELAIFNIGENEFQIQIEQQNHFPNIPEFDGAKIGEISFAKRKLTSVEAGFKTQHTNKSPIKVYGAVANGLAEKFKEYDVFYFAVHRRHSETEKEYISKQNVYMTMANTVKSSQECWYYETPNNTKTTAIISKKQINDETSKRTGFINPLKEAMLALNMHIGCGWFDDL